MDGNGIKDVDLSAGKLPCADASFEKQIQFCKGAARGLGNTEVSVDDAEEADAGPEEAGIVFPIPLTGIQHVRRQDGADDADDVVQVAAQDDCLDL